MDLLENGKIQERKIKSRLEKHMSKKGTMQIK